MRFSRKMAVIWLVMNLVIVMLIMGLSMINTNKTCDILMPYHCDKETKPTYEYLKSVTVIIEATRELKETDENGIEYTRLQRFGGTGVIVKVTDKYTYILTCRHMSERDEKIFIISDIGESLVPATIIKKSESIGEDLLLVKVNKVFENKRQIIGVGSVNPQDRVYVVGNPNSQDFAYGEGVFSNDYIEYSYIQIPTFFGSSGSGVFNSKGELISIISSFGFNYKGSSIIGDCTRGKGATSTQIKLFLLELNNEKE